MRRCGSDCTRVILVLFCAAFPFLPPDASFISANLNNRGGVNKRFKTVESSMQTDRIKQEARAALAEFLACVFFVFFGAGSVVGAISATSDAGVVEPVNYALSFGFSITILAFSIGDLSGAHINPAVTLSLAVSRNLTPTRAFMYIAAQIAGGVVGGGFLFMCVDDDSYHSGIGLANDITPAGE